MIKGIFIINKDLTSVFEFQKSRSSLSFNSLKIKFGLQNKLQNLIKNNSNVESRSFIILNDELFLNFEHGKFLSFLILFSFTPYMSPVFPIAFTKELINFLEANFESPLMQGSFTNNTESLTIFMNEIVDNLSPIIFNVEELEENSIKNQITNFLTNNISTLIKPKIKTNEDKKCNNIKSLINENNFKNIYWRNSGIKYINNEIFVDLNETFSIILQKKKKSNNEDFNFFKDEKILDSAFYSFSSENENNLIPLIGSISGSLVFTSYLSDIPIVELSLSVHALKNLHPLFHKCVVLDRWLENPGTLVFVPPDGKIDLMKYNITFDGLEGSYEPFFSKLIDVEFQTKLGENKNEFLIKLSIKEHNEILFIKNITVEINCKDFSDHNKLENDLMIETLNIKSLRCTHGELIEKNNSSAKWHLHDIKTGSFSTLHGSINILSKNNSYNQKRKSLEPNHIKISYSHEHYVPSGIKVINLKLLNIKKNEDNFSCYKGIKYLTKTGNFFIRS